MNCLKAVCSTFFDLAIMEKVLVSIRCLAYNHASYIRQCLDGFVMQKTNFCFEAIVHDDASTDGTAAIIREYAEKYPNIIKPIFETENQYSKHDGSLRDIMNVACKGKYIAMCEGDDYWIDPYKLQKQVDFMEQHPDYVACFHNARVQYKNHVALFNNLEEKHHTPTEDIIKRRWFIATPSLLYRNIVLEMPEWSKEVVNGDYMMELLLAKEGKFYYMDDVMAVYRQDGQGMSSVLKRDKVNMIDRLIDLLEKMKLYYGDEYAPAFDKSIRNYQTIRDDYEKEAYFEQHPIARFFRPKTYKRMIKKKLRSIVQ